MTSHGSRSLSRPAFDRFLALLAEDREVAAERYESLRHKLTVLFRRWGSSQFLELADTALDRAATRIADGAPVPAEAIGGYLYGIARNLLQDDLRARNRESAALRTLAHSPRTTQADDDPRAVALDGCLDALSAPDRSLILEYYSSAGTTSIEPRRNLAALLGITATALRIRAHRVRARLEACVSSALKRSSRFSHERTEGTPSDD